MEKKKTVSFTVSEEIYDMLQQFSRDHGYGRVGALARILAVQEARGEVNKSHPGEASVIKVKVNNYPEIKEYVHQKRLGKVEVFAAFVMEQYMNKHPLTKAQQARFNDVLRPLRQEA